MPARRIPFWLLFCLAFVLTGGWLFGGLSVAGWVDYFLLPVQRPATVFHTEYSDHIVDLSKPFVAAGAALGDRVLAIGGGPTLNPFIGFDQEIGQISRLHVGDAYTLRLQKPDGRVLEVTARLAPQHGVVVYTAAVLAVLLQAAFPLLCLAIGTWVLLVRPYDENAWWTFFILHYMQTFFGRTEQWAGFPAIFMPLWSDFGQAMFPVAALFFGLDFPQRFGWEKRRGWLRWLLAGPILLLMPVDFLELYSRYCAVSLFRPAYVPFFHAVDKVEQVFGIVCVSIFCALLFTKLGTARSKDARRRLRVLVLGTQIGLWPSFILLLLSAIQHKDFNRVAPYWVFLSSLILFMLFPLSLAYVVIVERAMDVRILLRQGTQYALARGTLHSIRAVLGLWIGGLAYRSIVLHSASPYWIFLPVGFLILLRWGLEARAQQWIDRRFFRESYAAEQVLSELMTEAGQFTETAPLLETVGKRIAETLHIDNMAMLLRTPNGFRLQTAIGVDLPVDLTLASSANSVNAMMRRRGPATVYFDRPEAWLVDATPQERELLRELNVEVLLPLPGRGRLMGVLALGPKRSEQPYSKSDLQLLTSVGTQTGLALENSELIQTLKVELAQSARMNRELEIAREVQERLFPQSFPQVAGVQVAGACRPAQGVGGDYYDCMLTGHGRLGLAIGDVSGKGISAALLMASLRAGLRGQTMQGATNLALIVTNINDLLYDSSASNRYATFFFGEYDPATRKICYVNAGHNPPVLLRLWQDGTWQRHELTGGGPVVGLLPGARYEQFELQMRPGDLLLLYTDGISEAMDPGEEEWGEGRMVAEAERLANGNVQDILSGLVIAADAFAAGAPQHDDMTLLLMKLDSTGLAAG